MTRNTLLDFFEDFARQPQPFLVHDDGYRVRRMTYAEVGGAARTFAARLASAGITPGDKIVFWSENRLEWVVALWGTLLARAVVVPVDYRASADLLVRIVDIVSAKIVLVGGEVTPPPLPGRETWTLEGLTDAGTGGERVRRHTKPWRSG